MTTLLTLALVLILNFSSCIHAKDVITPETSSIKALRKWVLDNGGYIHPKVSFHEKNGIRGMYTTDNIQVGETVFRLPNQLIMTSKTVQATYPELYKATEHTGQAITLAMFILACKQDPMCFYKPWMDSLPEYSSNYCFYDQRELDAFRFDDNIYREAFQRVEALKNEYTKLESIALSQPNIFPSGFDFSSFRWAVSMVASRAWGNNGTTELRPVEDLINSLTTGEDACYIHSDPVKNQLDLAAPQTYNKGDEIFCSYGSHSSTTYLLNYGMYDNRCSAVLTLRPSFRDSDWGSQLTLDGYSVSDSGDAVGVLLDGNIDRNALALYAQVLLSSNVTVQDYREKIVNNNKLLSRYTQKFVEYIYRILAGFGLQEDDETALANLSPDDHAMQLILTYKIRYRQCLFSAVAKIKQLGASLSQP